MTTPVPTTFVREAGQGPGVVCIHSNTSSSSQWRALTERLAPRYRVLAPDSYASGKGPMWPHERWMTLDDELDLLQPVFDRAGERFHIVGHSYGAAIALKAALRLTGRVASLALFEPTLFALMLHERPDHPAAGGILAAVRRTGELQAQGRSDEAAGAFIDYWMGHGAWAQMPPERKPAIVASVRLIEHWGRALCTEPLRAADFATLDVPVLYLQGERTTESAKGVAEVLLAALPQATAHEFSRRGHMAPITHADEVNAVIEAFLDGVQGGTGMPVPR